MPLPMSGQKQHAITRALGRIEVQRRNCVLKPVPRRAVHQLEPDYRRRRGKQVHIEAVEKPEVAFFVREQERVRLRQVLREEAGDAGYVEAGSSVGHGYEDEDEDDGAAHVR